MSFWWLLIAYTLGAFVGFAVAALLRANGD